MRILVNSMYRTERVMMNSLSNSSIKTAKLLSRLPNVWVTMPLPDKSVGRWDYDESDVEGIDEVIVAPYQKKYETRFLAEEWWRYFSVMNGSTYYDLVIDFNPRTALQFNAVTRTGFPSHRLFVPPIQVQPVIRPLYLLRDQKEIWDDYVVEVLSCCMFPTMYQGAHQRDEVIRAARELVGFSYVRKALDNSVVIPLSIDVDRIQFKQRKNPDSVRIMFATSLNPCKQIEKIAKMVDRIWSMGRRIEMVISMPWWSGDSSDLEEYLIGLFPILKTDHGRLYVNPERRVYEQLLSEADVFVGMSEYESFGISYFEQLQGGQVGVYLDRPWSRAVLPKDYPFLYESDEEVFGALLWVIDNLEKAQNRVKDVEEWLRENLNDTVISQSMYGFVKKYYDQLLEKERKIMVKSWLYKLLEAELVEDRYTMKELGLLIREKTKKGLNIFMPSANIAHTVRRMTQLLGYRDRSDDSFPVFEKCV